MNGAHALLETLVAAGIEVCFANPGTSEMHLVTAIGKSDAVRPILCLFEGVATGAADGYARMRGRPAVTLLHLAPGYANGMANLHNASKAHSPMINIVGDHAVWHHQYNAPLTSDVPGHARLQSEWVRVSTSADDLALAGAEAVAAATSGAGRIATLIVPANHAWEEATRASPARAATPRAAVVAATIERIARLLRNGRRTALVLGSGALREVPATTAGRIAHATGATLLCETFAARIERGAGRVPLTRIPYFAEQAIEFLREFEQMILIGTQLPVAFFAYPGVASLLAPPSCVTETLADVHDDIAAALEDLAACLGVGDECPRQPCIVPKIAEGHLTSGAVADVISAGLPEHAIVCDEGITCGLELFLRTQGAPPHDWLAITGGSIGQGLPVSFGAAIACPERKVVAFQADGSAMYTVQSLWSMVRERADVTVVLLNNSSYAILNVELVRLKAATPTPKTLSMLDLSNPIIDWVSIARGMGMEATRARKVSEFEAAFARAMAMRGPHLIEVILEQKLDAGMRR